MTAGPRTHGHGHGHGHGVAFGDDHDAEHDEGDLPVQENPLWQQDNVQLCSVGIDIGSAGTQVVFSRLHLRRLGEELLSRYAVVRREPLFASRLHLTPYDGPRIDLEQLGLLLDEAYAAAGLSPEQVDTGAVILTGEALRRRNARLIASVVSERAGDVVCAAAGHHMEAQLAAFGSGAARMSHDLGGRVHNVEIGGGTTKLAVIENGRVVATAALAVGGRLVVVEAGVITRLEPPGRQHARRCGLDWAVGSAVSERDLDRVARSMSTLLVEAVCSSADALLLTEPLPSYDGFDAVTFSGGVAEYVAGTESRDFGDLGRRLGAALRAQIEAGRLPGPVRPADARIRATVLGASEYSVQLSGNTCLVTSPDLTLPRRNLPVLRPDYPLGVTVEAGAVAEALRRELRAFTATDLATDVVVALPWNGSPAYARLRALAEGVADGLAERIALGAPVYLVMRADIARTLGTILRDELGVGNDLVVLDGLLLQQFDYVDLGRLREPSSTVTVTIKSLVFRHGPATGRHSSGQCVAEHA